MFRRELDCEGSGYGIGAFAYYRRVVEETIGDLLDRIPALLSEEEKPRYAKALEEVHKTTVTQTKIELVKDLLPARLRPDGINPLEILHSDLSSGLHGKGDDECLDDAEATTRTPECCRTWSAALISLSMAEAWLAGTTDFSGARAPSLPLGAEKKGPRRRE